MSTPVSPPPAENLPDPEEAVAALDPETGEDYGPPEVVDPDREANEADQLEQVIEVPVDDDPAEGEGA